MLKTFSLSKTVQHASYQTKALTARIANTIPAVLFTMQAYVNHFFFSRNDLMVTLLPRICINSRLSSLVALLISLMMLPFSVKAIDVAIPVYANIIKNKPGSGLAIRADQYTFQGTYIGNTFSDINVTFDVVQLSLTITQYQLTVEELVHRCDSQQIYPTTTLDGQVIEKNDVLTHLNFDQSDVDGAFRAHQVLLSFPVIAQKAYEQSCQGVFAISVAEQL